jgi:acetolactate synthase regulatory subunit
VLPSRNLRRRGFHQIAMEQTKVLLVGSVQGIEMLVDT